MNQSSGPMIPAGDVTSIAAATTIVDVTNFVSRILPVWDVEAVVFQGYVTGGNALASGAVDFNILGTVDGVLWDTVVVATLSVTMVGVSKVVKSDPVDVLGYRALRLGSIKNNDTTYAATLVGLMWGKSYLA